MQRQRGRGNGFHHTAETKLKIGKGLLKKNAVKVKTSCYHQDFRRECSAAGFGVADVDKVDASAKTVVRVVDDLGIGISNTDHHLGLVRRAVASHVKSQSEGLAEFLRSPSSPIGLIAVATMDDADMTIKRPKSNHLDSDSRPNKRLKMRGRNVIVPVMNRTETLVMVEKGRGEHTQATISRSAHVSSPAQVLPASNWTTMYDRWKRWEVVTGSRPGDRVDPQQIINTPLQALPEKLLFLRKMLR